MTLCACGCGKELIIKTEIWHKYQGIPIYIHGHNKPWLGKHRTKEDKIKIGNGNRGKIVSAEVKNKISKTLKSMVNVPWRFKIGSKINLGRKHSEETRKKISESHKGIPGWSKGLTKETDDRVKKYSRPRTEECKRKISLSKIGDKNPAKREDVRIKISLTKTGENIFTGFKNTENERIRNSIKYENWRNKVFEKNNYTCYITSIKGEDLIVHHLNSFNNNIKMRFDINNGITLSKDIHKQFHDTYGYGDNTREQFIRFFYDYMFKRENLKL